MNRREFVASSLALSAGSRLLGKSVLFPPLDPPKKADFTLVIEPCKLEISPGVILTTTSYNGQVPGPVLRVAAGKQVHIDVTNRSTKEDLVHWHGQAVDAFQDGAVEEGSPLIAAGATRRYTFTPGPSGTRWYHTHAMACEDLSLGTYSGQFGFFLIDGKEAVQYDREVHLAIHHWEPSFIPMVEMLRQQSTNEPQTAGSDVGYKYATFNSHRMGSGEPIRVKQGERILMRFLNASATENCRVALPGHTFRVIAMDGNPVPRPREVDVLSIAVAERIDAIVEMKSPGVWLLASTLEKERLMGLGVVIEYAGRRGTPVWRNPRPVEWDYTEFAEKGIAPEPEETFTLTFRDSGPLNGSKFDTWTINNKSWPDTDVLKVRAGKRYRLVFRNGSGDQHPMHLHRHSFEVTRIGTKLIRGLMKDVINVMPLDSVAVDFIADNPGDTLMHCHQQLHMDYGFMQLIRYV